jgi:hypothetical protein
MNKEALISRVDALLATPWDRERMRSLPTELVQGTVTILEAVHGSGCRHVELLKGRIATIEKKPSLVEIEVFEAAKGALQNVKGEIEAGLLATLTRTITGEVLSDFLGLAKEALDRGDENGKNVAAVLAAAAFEDTIRRMGASFCGIHERDRLERIAIALKEQGILVGAQFGTVQAQLQFRNDASHADWNKIDVVGVRTALQLVQELLLKHFS